MAELGSLVEKVRSKNAGPFWLTIDIFCGSQTAFDTVAQRLETEDLADRLQIDPQTIKRFEIVSLNVIKISFPRPVVQGALADRDLHGASWASLVAEMEI